MGCDPCVSSTPGQTLGQQQDRIARAQALVEDAGEEGIVRVTGEARIALEEILLLRRQRRPHHRSFQIGQTFPLTEVRQAHEALAGRKTTGSTLLIP